jgi:hypothetical protein
MAAPGPWVLYNQFKKQLGLAQFTLNADTFYVALFTSASSAINAAVSVATYAAFASDGHEVGNGNGYTTGGVAVATPTWTGTSTLTFDVGNPSWTASSSGFTARAAVLYDSTTVGGTNYAIAYMLLDSTPADVTTAAGNTLTINVSNIFSYT